MVPPTDPMGPSRPCLPCRSSRPCRPKAISAARRGKVRQGARPGHRAYHQGGWWWRVMYLFLFSILFCSILVQCSSGHCTTSVRYYPRHSTTLSLVQCSPQALHHVGAVSSGRRIIPILVQCSPEHCTMSVQNSLWPLHQPMLVQCFPRPCTTLYR